MYSTAFAAAEESSRTISLQSSIGRKFEVQITAHRNALGLRRYTYHFPGSDAQVTLITKAGKTPYFESAPRFTRQGEVVPLSAETLGIVRAVQLRLVAPYRAGVLGSLLKRINYWLNQDGSGMTVAFVAAFLLLGGVASWLLFYEAPQEVFSGYIVGKRAVPAQWQEATATQIMWTGKTAMILPGQPAHQVAGPQYLIWVANSERTRVLSMTKASWDTLQTGRPFHLVLSR